jgi:hypothetical protein
VGEFPADFAVLSSMLDAGLDVVDATFGPRIAFFDISESQASKSLPPIAVDPRYPRVDLCFLADKGWPLHAQTSAYASHTGYVDVVAIKPGAGAHTLRGVPAALLEGRAKGY